MFRLSRKHVIIVVNLRRVVRWVWWVGFEAVSLFFGNRESLAVGPT